MSVPIRTPLEPSGDKVEGVLARLAFTPGEALALTTLAVRQFGGVFAYVIFHLNDGAREHLVADDARAMAAWLRELGGSAAWADSLDEAADTADRQASAILLAVRASAGVASPREFRGLR